MTRAHVAVGMAVAAIVAIAAGSLVGNDDRGGPPEREPERVRVVMDSTLRAGTEFLVRYEVEGGIDPNRLRPPVSLMLWHDGKERNRLLTSGNPKVQPPHGGDTPLVGLVGPGPYDFELPDELESGAYTLCSHVGIDGQDTDGDFCRTVEVRGR